MKKYGPVFGYCLYIMYLLKLTFTQQCCRYYVGAAPKVAITDVEIAKEIMVKEFENFSDRGFMVCLKAPNRLN